MPTVPGWLIPFFILLGAILAVGTMDYHDEQVEQQHYCEMVKLWHENDHLPHGQRPGWPPYKGECNGQD